MRPSGARCSSFSAAHEPAASQTASAKSYVQAGRIANASETTPFKSTGPLSGRLAGVRPRLAVAGYRPGLATAAGSDMAR
jgi:hypothetical protein